MKKFTSEIVDQVSIYENPTPVDLSNLPPAEACVILVAIEEADNSINDEVHAGFSIEALAHARALTKGAVRTAMTAGEKLSKIDQSPNRDKRILKAAKKLAAIPHPRRHDDSNSNRHTVDNNVADAWAGIDDERTNDLFMFELTATTEGMLRYITRCLDGRTRSSQVKDTDRAAALFTLAWLENNEPTSSVVTASLSAVDTDLSWYVPLDQERLSASGQNTENNRHLALVA